MLSLQKRALLAVVCSILALFCFSGTLSAQQVFGSIVGTVTDPTGAAVSGAKITVTDTQKGTQFTTTTNDSGNYTQGQLIPGQYQVTIEASGFQKTISNPITVQVDQVARFDVAMQVGNVTQEVEVTAAAPLLQSDRADVAQTFDAHQIEELPSVGRNLQAFELLNPGTVPFGWAHASDENPQGSVQMVVNGQVFDAMGYELDGTTNQDPILGIIVINPTFDSVAEVKQANQDFDAEFSYTGAGLATYSTKSGTNEYHGDVFEAYPAGEYARLLGFRRESLHACESCIPPEPVRRLHRRQGDQRQAVFLRRYPIEPASAGRFRQYFRTDCAQPHRQLQRLAGRKP